MHAQMWFKRLMWLGIVANMGLAIPTLLAPERMIEFIGLPMPTPLLWTRFAALLLIILSLFYMPAGIDPVRYRLVAYLTLVSRLFGVVFFVGFQAAEYHMFGYFDLVFLVPQALLLFNFGPSTGPGARR
jgi:hypothetical protein